MNIKEKFLFIFVTLITLGIYPIVIKVKSKKTKDVSGELSVAKKTTIKPEKIIAALGGDDNILAVEHTHTKIKVIFKEKGKVDVKVLESLKRVSGIFVTSRNITLIVGNQAKELAKML